MYFLHFIFCLNNVYPCINSCCVPFCCTAGLNNCIKYHFTRYVINADKTCFTRYFYRFAIDDYLKNIYTTYTQGKENTDEALNKVKEALNKDKNNPQIKFHLALLYLFKENYVKSIIELQDAIEYKRKQQDTSDICAYFRLMGLGYMNLKMYENALSLFMQCYKEYEYSKDYRSLMLIFTNTASLYAIKTSMTLPLSFITKLWKCSARLMPYKHIQ